MRPSGAVEGQVLLGGRQLPGLGFLLSLSLARHTGLLSPPHPKVPEWDRGRQPTLELGSGVCVVSGRTPNPTPPALAPAWWPWGPCLGRAPKLGRGRVLAKLAWRSHSSPGKAENRRPLCPGVPAAAARSPPSLLLVLPPASAFFSPILAPLLHTSSSEAPEAYLLPSLTLPIARSVFATSFSVFSSVGWDCTVKYLTRPACQGSSSVYATQWARYRMFTY